MAAKNRVDAFCAPPPPASPRKLPAEDESFELSELESELKRLSAVNEQLLSGLHEPGDTADASPLSQNDEVELLRLENAELKARLQELEAVPQGSSEEFWQERQREYEMLLEEKSEVIRGLHQRIHELQESRSSPKEPGAPAETVALPTGQAEEILRLKREIEDQRKQLRQDEEDMMAQLRQMELTMARERAEMARQRQEIQRLQSELAREMELSNRDPELRDRLHNLRRNQDGKQADKKAPPPAPAPAPAQEQKSSSFFRRIFG